MTYAQTRGHVEKVLEGDGCVLVLGGGEDGAHPVPERVELQLRHGEHDVDLRVFNIEVAGRFLPNQES